MTPSDRVAWRVYEYVAKPDHPNPSLLYLIVDIVLQV